MNLEITDLARVQKLTTVSTLLSSGGSNDTIRLSPGECFEQIFRLKISEAAEASTHNSASGSKKKQEIDQFGELFFSWYSISHNMEPQLIGIKASPITNHNQDINHADLLDLNPSVE